MFSEFVRNLGLKIERVVCKNPKPRGTETVDYIYIYMFWCTRFWTCIASFVLVVRIV